MDKFSLEPPLSKKEDSNSLLEFLLILTISLVAGFIIYWFIAQPHKVSGNSMIPTFHSGDYIITNKIIYHFENPKRGDVVVLQNPLNHSEDYIKRIVGLPGEKIKIQNGKIYINGNILIEPYLPPDLKTPPDSFLQEGQEVIIPVGYYVVMGDNRTHSFDSRKWGFVKKEEIVGKVIFRYWPKDVIGFI